MNGTGLTIGEAAKACGLSSKNIRYYEQIGLIPKAARHNLSARTGGNRFYGDADLRRLRFIRSSRLLCLGLKDIAQLIDLLERGSCPGAQPQYREKLRHHLTFGMSAEGGRRLWFGGDNLRLKLETGKMWGEVLAR